LFSVLPARTVDLSLANCYFSHDSSGFLALLPFFDAHGTDAAKTEQPSQGGDQVDKKNG